MSKEKEILKPHYYSYQNIKAHKSNLDVIDIIEIMNLNFNRGNCLKYIARAGTKDPKKEIEDLNKAIEYLEREKVRLLESKEVKF